MALPRGARWSALTKFLPFTLLAEVRLTPACRSTPSHATLVGIVLIVARQGGPLSARVAHANEIVSGKTA